MATPTQIKPIQGLINQRGLTRDQAKQQYGLSQEDTDWMSSSLGLRFASQGAAPRAAIPAPAPAPQQSLMTASAAPKPSTSPAAAPSAGGISLNSTDAAAAPAPSPVPTAMAASSSNVAPSTATAAPAVQAGTATPTAATTSNAQASLQGPAATYEGAQGTASTYDPAQSEAAQWKVGRRATVQGQLAKLTKSGSPLMQQAETRGLQSAASRGLMNSSMAVQAGQAALYDAAVPIATADAATFADQGKYNAGNRQQTNLVNQQATNTAAQFNAGQGQEMTLANMSSSNTANQFNAGATNDVNRNNANLQTGVNVGNADRATDVSTTNANNATHTSEFNVTAGLQAGLANQAAANNMSQFNAGQTNDLGKFSAALNADISKFNASESNDLTALGMDGDTRRDLANIEASYKILMQTSASAGDIYKQYMGSIAQILQNKDMDEGAKTKAIGTLMGSLNSSLDVMADIAGMDIPDLTFGGGNDGGGGGVDDGTDGSGTGGAGNGETSSNGYPLPSTISGVGKVDWSAKDVVGRTLKDQYDLYAMSAGPSALSPAEWLRQQKGTPAAGGSASGLDATAATSGNGTAADGGGMSA